MVPVLCSTPADSSLERGRAQLSVHALALNVVELA